MNSSRYRFAVGFGWLFLIASMQGCLWGNRNPCSFGGGLEGCGTTCEASSDCAAGLYCGAEGTCTADCSSKFYCPVGLECSSEGRCVSTYAGAGTMDATTGGFDAGAGFDGGGAFDGGSGFTDGGTCADISLMTKQVNPSVIVIADRSGSMSRSIPGSTDERWTALEDALVGVNTAADPRTDICSPRDTTTSGGLIHNLQDRVRFGLTFYTATGSSQTSCDPPIIDRIPDPLSLAALGGYEALKEAFDCKWPRRFTPTHLAFESVLDDVLASPPELPVVFILATDGEPNCHPDGAGSARAAVVAQVERAHASALAIETYVIGLAGNDANSILNKHLKSVANAGVGDPARWDGTSADFTDGAGVVYLPGNAAELESTLEGLITAQISCDLKTTDGMIVLDNACMGTVKLNGNTLSCDDPNGWTAIDEHTIRLQGAACEELKGMATSTVEATFPCNAARYCPLEFC